MIKATRQDHRILYFDESRFGTHSKAGRAWLKKGVRSRIKVKLGFKYTYLYTSVCANSGESHTLLLPQVNATCMNIYLLYLSEQLKNRKTLLIVDGAGWHKSKELKIPENIQLVFLPPYCPELNPVERLWRYVKDHTIKNRVFETLQQLEDVVCEFVKQLSQEKIAQICKT